jgi:dTDP-glucose pyrophosphorylase
MIDRAVVLAAGRGTRLGELTADTPKPLLDVGGHSCLERVLVGLAQAGIHRLALITGHAAQQVEEAVWGSAAMSVEFIRQEVPGGTGEALLLAERFAGGHPVVFAWSDVLVDPANYRAVIEAAEAVDAVIAVNQVEDPAAGAAVYVDEGWVVVDIVEKPPPGTSTTNWNSAGFGVLTETIWPHLRDLEPSGRGEYEFTDALASLLRSGGKIRAVPVVGAWFDIGTPEALTAARAHYEAAGNP